MMPGITHEMHVYVWRWFQTHVDGVEFKHACDGMLLLNAHVKYRTKDAYFLTKHTDLAWRVSPAVFQMFVLHMKIRHGIGLDDLRDWFKRYPDDDVYLCCPGRQGKRFCL